MARKKEIIDGSKLKGVWIDESDTPAKAKKEKPKTKLIKKYFATYKGPRGSITLAPRIGRVVRGVPFEITEYDANTLVRSNFIVSTRYERIEI